MPYIAIRSIAPLTVGNRDTVSLTGHAWVEISGSQVSPDGKTESYGFYPESSIPLAPGEIRRTDYDNYEGHGFSSQQFYITEDQAQYVRLYALQADAGIYALIPTQLLSVDNCATFAFEAMRRAGVSGVLPIRDILPWWLPEQLDLGMRISSAVTTAFHAAASFTGIAPPFLFRSDPLTLDLDNDGLETIGIDAGNPILFDHNADGVKTATGWVKSDDGFLVLDRNGNGVIDSGAELFGDNTPLSAGGFALDGFGALAQEDTNADGMVDAADARFGQLRLWRDLNQDGISQSDELFTLEQEGIAAIKVAKTENTVFLDNGNLLADLGGYIRTDGSGGTLGIAEQLADIDLVSDPFYSQFTDHIALTDAARALPDMQGSGMVRNLREAASLPTPQGEELARRLADYSAAGTRTEQLVLLGGLVQAWAATSTLDSRDGDQLYTTALAWRRIVVDGIARWSLWEINSPLEPNLNQQTLAMLQVVEAFNGSRIPGNSFFSGQLTLFEQSRSAINESVYGGLVLQTRLKPYLDAITLEVDESGISLNYAGMMALLDAKKAGDAENAVFDLVDLSKYASGLLTGWDGMGEIEAWAADPGSGSAVAFALAEMGFDTPRGSWSGLAGDDSVFGSSGADRLSGQAGNDLLMGAGGNDTLVGSSGSDTLVGGAGEDVLMAGSNSFVNPVTTDPSEKTANTLQGGNGNDRLYGSGGSETYRFNLGDGADTIYEVAYHSASDTAIDRIVLGTGIAPGDATVQRDGIDLILNFAHAGDKITIAGWYSSPGQRIEQLVFADGTLWDRATLHNAGLIVNGTMGNDALLGLPAENDTLNGGDGNDTLVGYGGSDILTGGSGDDVLMAGSNSFINPVTTDPNENAANTLQGGAGADRLYGGGGAETYRFDPGDGTDTIYEVASNGAADRGTDRVVLGAGIVPADLRVTRNATDLIFNFADAGDKITIAGWYGSSAQRIEQLVFADGTVWDRATLHDAGLVMNGTTGAEKLSGLTGENDTLSGGDGNDTLIGSGGSDLLSGGAGDDALMAGNQTYLYSSTTDPYENSANTLQGGAGDDQLYGGGGSETYRFNPGDGKDTITETGYLASQYATPEDVGLDRIVLGAGIAPADVTIMRSNIDLVLKFANAGDQITISAWYNSPTQRIEQLVFADGTVWERVTLNNAGLILNGTSGNDNLVGMADEADIIDGLGGNDTLNGWTGNDIYLFGRGSGQDTISENDATLGNVDIIRFKQGVSSSQVNLSRDNNALILAIAGTTNQISVANWSTGSQYRIERVEFLDGVNGAVGTVWDSGVLSQLPLIGTSGADTLSGADYAEVIDGLGGNDTLTGGAGNDVYLFGLGSGQDIIGDNDATAGNVDTIRFKAGVAPAQVTLTRDNSALIFAIAGTSDKITVAGWSASSAYRIERVEFLDGADGVVGSVWDSSVLSQVRLIGTAGADSLSGAIDADVIDGLAGNDTLNGGTGNDVYLFGIGSGQDTINENDATAGNVDTLRFKAGVAPSQVSMTRDNNGLILAINAGSDKITVANWTTGPQYRIERVEFLDSPSGEVGTVWDSSLLSQAQMIGTAGADSLSGAADADVIDGLGGNDSLIGGAGNDVYLFGMGSGQDTINENDATAGNVDTIRLKAGVAQEDVTLSRTYTSLVLAINGTGDKITVADFSLGAQYKIERIEFLDGPNGMVSTVWDSTVLAQVPEPPASSDPVTVWGTSSSETVRGTNGNDVIDAGAGSDTIYGGASTYGYGNDKYIFGVGSGQDIVIDNDPTAGNSDTVRVVGKSLSEIAISRSMNGSSFGNDLVIAINGTSDRLTVQNYFTASGYKIEKVQFDDGTVWTTADLDAAMVMPSVTMLYGTAGNDAIDLRNVANTTIYGAGGGNNPGNDLYVFGAGAGQDTIWDNDTTAGNLDTIRIVGRLPTEVTVSRGINSGSVSNNLVIAINGTSDKLTVYGYFTASSYKIEKVQFDDGTVWTTIDLDAAMAVPTDTMLYGTPGSDAIDLRNSANTTVYGASGGNNLGNDNYVFGVGAGKDTIWDNDTTAGNLDTIRIVGRLPTEVTVSRGINSGSVSNNLVIAINGTSDKLTVYGYFTASSYKIEKVQFDDGTVWTTIDLDAAMAVPTDTMLYGTPGSDAIDLGNSANTTVYGASGGNNLGNDTYVFGVGAGQDFISDNDTTIGNQDTVKIVGKLPSEVTLSRGLNGSSPNNDLIIAIKGTSDKLTVKNHFSASSYKIEQVMFDDETLWTTSDLDSLGPNVQPTGNVTVSGTATQQQTLTVSNTLADADGLGAVVYQWQSSTDGNSWSDIGGTTGANFTLSEAQVGRQLRVRASYVDGHGHGEIMTSAATMAVVNVNDAPSGSVTISGTTTRNQTLTAANNLADVDGLGAVSYQWQSSTDGNDWSDIAAATAASYLLTEAQIGKLVRVQASYIDGHGTAESRVSDATAKILNAYGAPLILIGNAADNVLSGEAGNDTLNGEAGADTMIGGLGNDIYVVANLDDVVIENAGEGIDTVQSTVSCTLAANIEFLTLLGAATINGTGNELNNLLTGNAAANILTGGVGKDTLDGGAGADTLIGELGNDVYIIDNVDDVVVENAAEGSDTVRSMISYTLGANLENLLLLGNAAINGTGNGLDNILLGNVAANILSGGAGNDTLNGAAGADTLSGGAGNDNYTVDNVGDVIVELADEGLDSVNSSVGFMLPANVERLTLTGPVSNDGTGNELANLLTGNAATNVLSGGAGNDTLNGGAGADTLEGGVGDDSYIVDDIDDVVSEDADEGVDSVNAVVSYALPDNLENLSLTGTAEIDGTGNALANLMIGNAAANVLNGGPGADTLIGGPGIDMLIGGEGNDYYVVDNVADVVIESASQGVDLVRSSVRYTLPAEVENLTLTGPGSINGTGNGLDNLLIGTADNNILTGLAGNDTLDGMGGTDLLAGGTGNDTYVFGRGYASDKVRENDTTPGNTDIVQFLSGISSDQIWLRHVGNNLVVSIIGTRDKLTIENWYLDPAYQIEQFRTADGKLLEDGEVENLVQVMGVYAPPAAGQITLSQNYPVALAQVIATSWQ